MGLGGPRHLHAVGIAPSSTSFRRQPLIQRAKAAILGCISELGRLSITTSRFLTELFDGGADDTRADPDVQKDCPGRITINPECAKRPIRR